MRRLIAVVALLVLVGCTDSGQTEVAGPSAATPSAPAPSSAAPSTPAPTSPKATAATPSTAKPSASAPSTSSVAVHRVPATVTFTDVPQGKSKAHRQALKVYQEFYPAYMKTLSTLEMDPAIRSLAPELVAPIQKEIKSDAKNDSHYAGETRVQISDVTGDRSEVTIKACLDVRDSVVITAGKVEHEPKPYIDSVVTLNYVATPFGRGLAVSSFGAGKNIC